MTHDIITILVRGEQSMPFFCPSCNTKLLVKYKPDLMDKVLSIHCPKCDAKIHFKMEPDEAPKPNIPLAEGTVLNGQTGVYTIQQVLGHGSFGITYLADAQMTMQANDGIYMPTGVMNRRVAVKEFFIMDNMLRHSDGTIDKQSLDMNALYYNAFKNEAKMLMRMHNEHIVNVYDQFEANHTIYYVMEYLDGGTLANQWQGRYTLKDELEAINIMLQIAYSVEYMHTCGFVHLDIKPQNIMRRSDGTWVLIDFGISRRKEPTTDTSPVPPIGITAGYAPIEQFSANPPLHTLPLMDIYALGATCYWLCDGRPPEAYEVLNQGLPIQEWLAKGISPYTAHTVNKAMQPLYTNRYKEVSQLIDDLLICRQYIGAIMNSDPEITMDDKNATMTFQDIQQSPTVPIFDNLYDGHTIFPLSINGVDLMCEPGKNIKQLEEIITDMSPCPFGLISNHPVETIGDDIVPVILTMLELQSYTSLRLELPSDIMIENWAKKHPFYSSDAPFLCFNGARAKLYEGTVDSGYVKFSEVEVSYCSRHLQLLIVLKDEQPFQFMPSQWSFGFHPVSKDGKWGLLRYDKHIVIPTDFDKITTIEPLFFPGPGPLSSGFIGCKAEKGSTIFFYELAPMQTMKLKRRMTREEYDELIDMT